MESWRLVWRNGFQPFYTTPQLECLLTALQSDDKRLVQGVTITPPPLFAVTDWPVEAADAITFPCCEWGETTVGTAEEFFAARCFAADQQLDEPAACQWLLNWYDDSPRTVVFQELAAEITLELARRRSITALPLELQRALEQYPNDPVLRDAIRDYHIEHGDEAAADAISGRTL